MRQELSLYGYPRAGLLVEGALQLPGHLLAVAAAEAVDDAALHAVGVAVHEALRDELAHVVQHRLALLLDLVPAGQARPRGRVCMDRWVRERAHVLGFCSRAGACKWVHTQATGRVPEGAHA